MQIALALGVVVLGAGILTAAALHRTGKASVAEVAAQSLPDWSGQWEIEATRPDATGGFEHSLDEVVKGMRAWGPPPYAPTIGPMVEKAIAFQGRQQKDGAPATSPMNTCAFGYPQIMLASPLMFEALVTPKETALIFSGREIRHVYTDGRPHTAKEDLWPTFWGDSIGHWEGQTLVIDTIAVESALAPGQPVIPVVAMGDTATNGRAIALLSRQARFEERLRMVDGRLEDQMTISDPVLFSAPWHVSRTYTRVTGINHMVHEDCSGLNRNPVVDGKLTLAPPPPAPPPPPPELIPLLTVLAKAGT
ncbi:MAG: hypothetical protein ACXU82_02605 [Caulobacteraceae bacterium]